MGFVGNFFRSIGRMVFGREPRIPEMPKPPMAARDILPSTSPTLTEAVFNKAGGSDLRRKRGRQSLLINKTGNKGNGNNSGLNV